VSPTGSVGSSPAGSPDSVAHGAPVVVGYDGSPDARSAVAWAARIARTLRAPLQVVHAVGLLEHAGLGAATIDGDAARAIATGEGMDPLDVEWCVVDGDPCTALLRMAASPGGVALLVVGSRGASAHPGTLLGSTSLELAERAPVPLTIVPPGRGSD
jgi:nucleotide-binding universal stress UspA family protein